MAKKKLNRSPRSHSNQASANDKRTEGPRRDRNKKAAAQVEPQHKSQLSTQPVKIAVIGDVNLDWGFLSREPAPSRVPQLKPWTRDTATHLFAFPGGAWFSGHMLQGALATPTAFSRKHSFTVKPTSHSSRTIATLQGDLHFPMAPIKVALTIPNPRCYRLLLDDQPISLPNSAQTFNFELSRPSERSQKTHIHLGVTNIHLEPMSESGDEPGHFFPHQVARAYEIENVVLPPDPLECRMLEIRNCIVTDPTRTLIKKQSQRIGSVSLSPISPDLNNDDLITIRFPDDSQAVTLRSASLDITYAYFEAKTQVVDLGKLNPPLQLTPQYSSPPSVNLLCTHPFHDSTESQLFIYDNPRESIGRPDASELVYSVSQLNAFKRYGDQKSQLKVYRRIKDHGLSGPRFGYPLILDRYVYALSNNLVTHRQSHIVTGEIEHETGKLETLWNPADSRRSLVVVDDEGLGFDHRKALWSPFLQAADKDRGWVIIKASQWLNLSTSGILKELKQNSTQEHIKRRVLVISGESLRNGFSGKVERPGIKLSKTVSWERLVEDFGIAWNGGSLNELKEFGHVLIRLGMEGALYIHTNGADVCTKLYFDRQRIEGEYAPSGECGNYPGLTTVFTCAIATRVVDVLRSSTDDVITSDVQRAIDSSIPYALRSIRRYFDMGYGPNPETILKYSQLQLPVSQIFKTGRIRFLSDEGLHSFESCDITEMMADNRPLPPKWSLMNLALGRDTPSDTDTEAAIKRFSSSEHAKRFREAVSAIKIGRQIVLRGVEKALSGHKGIPFARFKDFVSVDRFETEGLRSIRNLLLEYENNKERRMPLSVAVFGPPGSGKSFVVKQIAASVTSTPIVDFTFNMGQFASFSEVTKLLLQVRDVSLANKMPLVFFDEFDSIFDGNTLGWLKYFLSPMQDGQFQHDDSLLSIGRAIFVFAGGICSDHDRFIDSDAWDELDSKGRKGVYTAAKGKDFHSRLRGFLNIKGIDPILSSPPASGGVDSPHDPYEHENFAYVVRRAILIRQMIERFSKTGRGGILDVDCNAEIDRDILDAFLLTDSYLHGVRSLEAIFQMSVLHDERAFNKTALPSHAQLSMHVDESFYRILRRAYSELQSKIVERAIRCSLNGSEVFFDEHTW